MKKRLLLSLTLLITMCPIISGCSLFENGDINDYVGNYRVTISYERRKHYYWGNTTLISESCPVDVGAKIVIRPDKKVEFSYPMGDAMVKGRVRVFKDYVTFTDLNFSSSYKFKKKDNKALDYSYTENKVGLEYDYVTRRIYLEYSDPLAE